MIDSPLAAAAADVAHRVASGAPSGDWTAPETLLAMLFSVYCDPSKLRGTQPRADGTERQHPAIVAIANAIGRSQGAVVRKVMNLMSVWTGGEFGLDHTAKLDTVTVERYATHFDTLVVDAFTVARHLPGAAAAIEAIVPRAIVAGVGNDESTVADTGAEPETERIAQAARRMGQGVFRGRVLSNYAHACAFCGLRSRKPDDNSYLLLASHIRPWAESTGHQRLDPTNGFSLCAIHDRAFEWGFLTVDEDRRVVASDHASEHYAPEERVRAEILALNGVPLIHPDRHFLAPGEAYLAYHREEIYERRFRRGA